ncbi:hypothetical protein [Mucilaginibacter aquariorum]|uniref:DUF1700 domain-containing protein n=1 Tax=Mucilaginibacter aquariorum TaxID=2967225 RepID=A0ABT1T6C5_9SPHI|nr:hypothetical protein [Mucilaginibacter aquariorum]MCQ6960124.1 hypothetical protein [Mucilaginibacter aquariorum]
MKRIIFTNPTAQKIYDDYFASVTSCISILSPTDQQELLMELNSHVYEATHCGVAGNEVDILVDALHKLGAPELVLQPAIAYKKVQQAGRSFNPKHILQALYLNVANGAGFFVIGIIYLLILAFGSLAIIKLISPTHTGLFVQNGHWFAFGYTSDLPDGLIELLGNWFIAVVIALMGIFYFLNTLLFRLLKKR